MPLTRDFRETVKNRADRDPEFREGLLTEAMDAVVQGDFDTAKILLRDYINATDGFQAVGESVGRDPKSLMRMLSRSGNPSLKNFFDVTSHLQNQAGVKLGVTKVSGRQKARRKRSKV